MKVRKFTAKTSRDALRQVREDLGPDAAILANRMVKNGVEVIAVAAKELPQTARPEVKVRPLEMTEADVVGEARFKPAAREVVEQRIAKASNVDERDQLLHSIAEEVRTLSARVVPERPAESMSEAWLGPIISEMKVLKDMVGSLAFQDVHRQPEGKAQVIDQLTRAGFSQGLAMQVVSRLPREISVDAAERFALSALAQKMRVSDHPQPIIDEQGIFALVGPTGVGKTTTLAKLAARFVVRHGAEHLALISTDGYRIGGQEQLKIYGKLLGVTVHCVRDSDDLSRALNSLSHKKLILIDTVGRSQRDSQLVEQKRLFREASDLIQRVLLLNTTCHGDTLEDVVEAYGEGGLAGVILSKLDEARTVGGAIEVALRRELKVLYATHGQRVPEDLKHVNPKELITETMNLAPKESMFSSRSFGTWAFGQKEGRVHG